MRRETCSKSCASKRAYVTHRVTAPCTLCGEPAQTAQSVLSANLPVYCSKCANKRYRITCVSCGKEFKAGKYNAVYCSKECQVKHQASNTVEVTCAHCGERFSRRSSDMYKDRHFCSKRCRNNQYTIEHPTRYGGTWTTWLRRIHARDNEQCQCCGATDGLQVHHFIKLTEYNDPNDAHFEENLVLLCKKHHAELEDSNIRSLSEFVERYSPTLQETAGGKQK